MALSSTFLVRAESIRPIQEVFEPATPADPSLYTKVAVIQWAPAGTAPITPDQHVIDSYKESVREALSAQIRDAASNNAHVVITPEF
ncbi:MAG: hypothetical protein ABIR96_01475, partial [Bdellovibrionota bacterium]